MLRTAANALVRALLAPVCAACRAPLDRPMDGPVCPACWAAVPRLTPPLCDLCGDPLPPIAAPFRVCRRCLADPPRFETARSAGLYAGSLRAIIHAFKYDGRRTLAGPLAALMREAGATLFAGADAVVPVPLHPWRAMRRGFNQADDLARHLGLPVRQPIRRVQHGPPQASLNGRDRRANVTRAFGRRGGFTVGWDRDQAWRLRNQTVVLVDDVMTTGATLDACSRALLEAGVARVRVLTVARVPGPPPGTPPHAHHPWTALHR
jgi:ComF family protein